MSSLDKKYSSQSELENQLVRKHYGLVVSQALKFVGSDKQSLEDYIQVGLIGLLKAIRKYDESRAKFSTFASKCIKNELINFINRSVKKNKSVKIIYNSDLLSGLSEKYADNIDAEAEILSYSLTEEEQSIVMKKMQNCSDREICREINCSKPELKNKIENIVNKLKG